MFALSKLWRVAILFGTFLVAPLASADILVGVAGPLSGPNATFGNELKSGASAAIAAINAQGGINGEPLALVEGDDACDAKRALDVAKSFVSQDVRLVIGHFCTYASLAAAPTYANAGIVMISPSSTSPLLTSNRFWNVMRLTAREDMQGEIAAARIKADGVAAETVVISDQSPDLAEITKRFQAALPNSKLLTVKAGSAKRPDDPALITATAVYVALQPSDAGNIAADLRTINPSAVFYGPDSLQSDSYSSKAAEAANGTHITFIEDPTLRADPKRLATLPSAEGAALNAYAAVEAYATAAKTRNVNDSRAIANWLTSGNEISTILGTLSFTETGDLKRQPYMWLQWQDKALVSEKSIQ